MKEVFQEYGGIIITIIAILSLIAVVTAVIGNDQNGLIGEAFSELIESFLEQADFGAEVTTELGTELGQ